MSSKNRLEQSIEWFQTSLSAGRLAHAYVVVGSPRGDGAEFVARALSLLYDDAASSVDRATHPDVLWVEPQRNHQSSASNRSGKSVCARRKRPFPAGGRPACWLGPIALAHQRRMPCSRRWRSHLARVYSFCLRISLKRCCRRSCLGASASCSRTRSVTWRMSGWTG